MKRKDARLTTLSTRRRQTRTRVPLLSGALTVAVTASLALAPLGPVPAAQAVSCLVAPPGIEAYWPGNGTADELVHGRDGVAENGAGYAAGFVGQAFTFDGVDDTVTVPDDPAWTLGDADFSQVMWVNMDSVGRAVFTSHDEGPSSPYPKWMFRIDMGVLYFDVNWPYNWQAMVSAPWTPTVGTWYHLAVTRDGDLWTLYVDGAVLGSSTNAATLPEIAAPVRLGYAEANESGVFALDGSLDEVLFFHRALSAGEVAAIHGAGAAGLCAPVASSLTVAASKTTIPRGSSVTLSGDLALQGGLSAGGRAIQLDRAMGTNPPVTVATVTTGAGGSFSFVDKPPEGTAHYTARFEGADNAVPASATTTVKVVVKESSLTLATSKRRVTYGKAVTLLAHLQGGTANRTVRILGQAVGGRSVLVAKGEVNAKGNFSVTLRPRATSTYTAVYAGEPAWTSAKSGPVRVSVAGRWAAKAVGGYARDGKYRLYHWSAQCRKPDYKGCPIQYFKLAPSHSGGPVVVTFQFWSGGRWRTDGVGRWELNEDSAIGTFTWYTTRDIVGIPHRTRAVFPGDATHERATSAWTYWKVTS